MTVQEPKNPPLPAQLLQQGWPDAPADEPPAAETEQSTKAVWDDDTVGTGDNPG